MEVSNYQKLIVWQKAMELTVGIFKLAEKLPKKEIYALSNQMRRAAVSIPSNIAEGHGRRYPREFVRFLLIARGSRAELETQLQLCVKVGYLTNADITETSKLISEIGKMLNTLIKRVDGSK